uniref:Cytochrome P450 3041C2 n=1 Tax=Lepeophtheirus salmonis TaxID=72036 RepID=A0A5Q0TYL6_LEPSM|nr:cytochrome P450 3041C2 [Lepeophtheirus salmonis salmonis]
MTAIYLILILCILIYLGKSYRRKSKFPPGPPNLPIVGTLPYMNGIGSNALTDPKFGKYGDLYSLFIGNIHLVVINNYQLAKDLFAREDVSYRRETWWTLNVRGDGHPLGIINTSGHVWKEQRRFAVRNLKDFGFGKNTLDAVIQNEARFTIEDIIKESKNNNGVLRMESTFNVGIINILWQIIAGYRFDKDNEKTKEMMGHLHEVYSEGYSILHYIPAARFFIKRDKRMDDMLRTKEFFRSQIREHMKDYDASNPRDFIDVYIKEMLDEDRENFHEEQLMTTCLDFFQAGGETSATTLLWSVLYISLYPEAQAKCVEEIEAVLGKEDPSQEVYKDMVYCNATLMEIQRMASVGPLTLPHVTIKDLFIDGYCIPRGTEIYGNIIAFHNNPKFFPSPKSFRPERFIENGKLKKLEAFAPFGVGKRICMGESMAKNQLFIFFVMMLQKLKISVSENHGVPDPEAYTMGITKIPKPFYISVSSR